MTASPQDVQSKITSAMSLLEKTTSSGSSIVKQHGTDWTKWPTTTYWYQAFSLLAAAKTEVGGLVAPAPPTSSFTAKVV